MYTKDKNHRITLRLNDEQFEFVRLNAETLDTSPSDFLRMVVNATMAISKNAMDNLGRKDGNGRENDKANLDNLV